MENNKITCHQLYSINATISLGGSILIISSTLASIAKQDAWLSSLIATVFGLLVMLLYYYLGSRYPGLTLIGIIRKVFGKWLGFFVSFCYVAIFIRISAGVPWFIGSYFGRVMHETPVLVINMLFMAGIVIAVLYGIETIARASELFIIFVSAIFFIFIILLVKSIKLEYITPMLENGFCPVLKGSFFMSCYITFSAINILMVFPHYVSDISKAKGALIKSQIWSGIISGLTILMTILVLGSALTERSCFPALLLATEISAGPVITRLEYVITIIWLTTQFMIGLFFFFSATTSLSELIGLKDYKIIVLPTGLIVLILSVIVFPNAVYMAEWDNLVYAPLITTFGFIIPLLLVIVYYLKKRFFSIQ
jgi:spore germination protein KB